MNNLINADMPLSSKDVRTLLGESVEASLIKENRSSSRADKTLADDSRALLARRTFEILRALEGTLPYKKKFSDGDLIAFKIIWDLVNRSHDTLKSYEKKRSDFGPLFELCNTINDESEIFSWFIYCDLDSYKIELRRFEPKRERERKLKNIELRLRELRVAREELVLKIKSSEARLSGFEKLDESQVLSIEIEINQIDKTMVQIERISNDEMESTDMLATEKLLSSPRYTGFMLENSIKDVMKNRRKLGNKFTTANQKSSERAA